MPGMEGLIQANATLSRDARDAWRVRLADRETYLTKRLENCEACIALLSEQKPLPTRNAELNWTNLTTVDDLLEERRNLDIALEQLREHRAYEQARLEGKEPPRPQASPRFPNPNWKPDGVVVRSPALAQA